MDFVVTEQSPHFAIEETQPCITKYLSNCFTVNQTACNVANWQQLQHQPLTYTLGTTVLQALGTSFNYA